jgi:hypothetical protein
LPTSSPTSSPTTTEDGATDMLTDPISDGMRNRVGVAVMSLGAMVALGMTMHP